MPRPTTRPCLTLPATALAITMAVCLPAFAQSAAPINDGSANIPGLTPAFPEQTEAPAQITRGTIRQQVIARGLEHPWAVAPLPGGAGYLVTERPGALRHIGVDGTISAPIANVPDVRAMRQGGLLDVAIAPDFAQSRVIYLTFAKPTGLGMSATAAIRATLSADMTRLEDVTEIFEQSPAALAPLHYGSRIVPLADGRLAITTGDRGMSADLAQDPSTGYGAVVMIRSDGQPAPGNPAETRPGFLPEVFSHGHRNIQGAAIQPETGQLWTVEHGPAGGDEVNIIAHAGNYGWPLASYGENYNGRPIADGRSAHAPDFIPPRYYWDPVIAPGGMVFYEGAMFPDWNGDLLIAGLIAQAVVRLDIDGDTIRGEERLADGVGRVRDVAVDADGSILFVTDFDDGELIRLTR